MLEKSAFIQGMFSYVGSGLGNPVLLHFASHVPCAER